MRKEKCIFRYINTCTRCHMNSIDKYEYCKVHQNNNNIVYNIINNVFIKNKINCNQYDFYNLFEYIDLHDNHSVY